MGTNTKEGFTSKGHPCEKKGLELKSKEYFLYAREKGKIMKE